MDISRITKSSNETCDATVCPKRHRDTNFTSAPNWKLESRFRCIFRSSSSARRREQKQSSRRDVFIDLVFLRFIHRHATDVTTNRNSIDGSFWRNFSPFFFVCVYVCVGTTFYNVCPVTDTSMSLILVATERQQQNRNKTLRLRPDRALNNSRRVLHDCRRPFVISLRALFSPSPPPPGS